MVFSAADLAAMRAAQNAHHPDTCRHLIYTQAAPDDYGMPSEDYLDGGSYACGFQVKQSTEVMDGTQVLVTAARLRLDAALEGIVNGHDRIRITHRHGEPLENTPTYEIVGVPTVGPSGLVIDLHLVTDGSDA